ncbi:unnamed protein product [Mytilus coruscus]|uniref:Uncharacterized protein n=1 Tax=Mytilus coruscus TaxID=42192 RepID=A0A6J8E3Q8_MYTCO|nr:unnamed protein product [Mytilus coruscus]
MKGLTIVSCLNDSLAELKKFKTCTSHDGHTLEVKVQIDDAIVLGKTAEIIKLKILTSCENIKNSSKGNLSNFKFHNFIEILLIQYRRISCDDSVQFSQILNICCCLIYNRDSKFQMLLADIIDKFTNSSTDCFNLLNKFGICVSKQTYERYQTLIVEERKSNSISSSKCQFQIASVDNINKRSYYSAVKSTDAYRGFDGTSIQLVIPKPLIELLLEEKQKRQCDNKDTIRHSLEILHQNLNVGHDINHLIVVGDGKTYDLFAQNGIWIGRLGPRDGHINYQRMLMKLYLDAGFKDFIEIFPQGATANSVIQAVNFDKTHEFYL